MPSDSLPAAHRFALLIILAIFHSCSAGSGLVVGSKNFTENLLLAEIMAQHLEASTGISVERRLNLGGTFLCHQALRSGQIDLYPEYTGTALTAILNRPVIRDPDEVYKTVSASYERDFAAVWMRPFGFNNTFAIVVAGSSARTNGLRTISDLGPVAPQLTLGFNFEFFERRDGYQGLIDTYELSFQEEPKTMDMSLVYAALRDGKIDVGVGNSTDGLISALGLHVLQDDRGYFPPYDAAPVVRAEALEEHPAIGPALNRLGGMLTEEEMRRWNYEVDGNQRPVAEVAREVLQQKGLL